MRGGARIACRPQPAASDDERKQNRAFAPRNTICARAPQRVNAARALKGVPFKARRRGQSPPTHGNLFRQLETNFVNLSVNIFTH